MAALGQSDVETGWQRVSERHVGHRLLRQPASKGSGTDVILEDGQIEAVAGPGPRQDRDAVAVLLGRNNVRLGVGPGDAAQSFLQHEALHGELLPADNHYVAMLNHLYYTIKILGNSTIPFEASH